MIKVSIIIPTYKRPSETTKCLELISRNQYLNEEFQAEAVVVDSSPDQITWNKIKKFQKDLAINYIHLQKQTMPGMARNIAVENAKNELVISLDSDIEVKKETLWQMIDYLKNHPTAARITGKSIFSSGSKNGQIDRPTKWDRTFKKDETVYIEGIYGRYEAFDKSAFQTIGGYDPIFEFCGEGTDLSIRFWRAGFPLALAENISVFHNIEAGESLRRQNVERMTQMYRSLFLTAFKYDVSDIKLSPHFVESHGERQAAYGQTTEFYSIVAAAKSIEWFKKNYKRLLESKKNIPKDFDFKPFDIFTDENLLSVCLKKAKERISPYYQKAFRE